MHYLDVSQGEYLLTTNPAKLDPVAIHDFLSREAYWSAGIPFATFKKSFDHSLNFGVLHGDKLVAYARIISDFATIAYLGDVFVLPGYRGKGLSRWMMGQVMAHPELQGLRRWILVTRDAHGLYEKFGWKPLARPAGFMELARPDVYALKAAPQGGDQ